ncbi:ATP:guanido phosphotransferase [Caloranaerobacter azorensis H53214]|uniref:Protein-arginine kinase n=1 Tax=Caloranaerobacter azorensis H53214 TaxID=1156417 RepID=A0A096BGW9_9FIRM|nr:protein arginine kinase [Caloranaerobacter azorensis]KGG80117.1 ATP:guanido phosphotransferase [Caloranaerobacter azorensis H53214]
MVKWLKGNNKPKDIVVSTRIRLARNIEDFLFPEIMTIESANEVINRVRDSIIEGNTILSREFDFFRTKEISPLDRQVFVEKHIISPGLISNPEKSAFLLRKDEKVTVMINEEDHIRIQVLLPGLELEKGWDLCNKIDDVIEENVKYAFDEKLGYLTSCPTNVGTGMRASVMLHLPSLVMTGHINKVLQAVNQVGLTVRGLYGEGTDASGNLFQISNQTTLGETEEEIIEKLKKIVLQIIDHEKESRQRLMNLKRIEVEDRIYRSLGILKNSRIITSKESMKLLSDVRMGIEMGIINDIDLEKINNLMILSQPASIQKYSGRGLNARERDIKRAEMIREYLK